MHPEPKPEVGLLESLEFDNRFTRELPADPDTRNHPRQVTGACFSRVMAQSVASPSLVAYSREMAEHLGLSEETCQSDAFVEVFSGNATLPGMDPHAACYGGHQFGNWAGQLGDGRAINLGDAIDASGRRTTLQLKGAGPTPYSRTADGLAVLRSSVREFLCSEAMHHLGIKTTRALSLVTTGESVMRDMFYDGNAKPEPGAVVCRTAPSFLRFGHFEIFASRGEIDLLKKLADFTIENEFPHLLEDSAEPTEAPYPQWFAEVCRTTAEMIVHWTRVGFVHGVMNTDNMSILGLTIDYGPYGWLDNFDPNWTPNTTDAGSRRYRFGNQAQIGLWNLVRLAEALTPLVGNVEPLQEALSTYTETHDRLWQQMMAEKLGLEECTGESDAELFVELLRLLPVVETDMTLFFRGLAELDLSTAQDEQRAVGIEPLAEAFYVEDQLTDEYRARLGQWLDRYRSRVRAEGVPDGARRERMNRVNPKFVLRNYIAQLAIDKAEAGDFSLVNETLEVMRHPYDEQPGQESFAQKRPNWARSRPGCSMLSCSS